MNERIRLLAEQAENYAAEQNDKFGVSYKKTYNEKFAELIVRECANVAADHEALDIYEEIREHFGVEQ